MPAGVRGYASRTIRMAAVALCSLTLTVPGLAEGGTRSPGKRYATNHPESFLSDPRAKDGLGSVAAWHDGTDRHWLIAAGEDGDRLLFFDADTGEFLRTLGRKGTDPLEFRGPSGVAVLDDHLFVVERDNRRVQVLRLPDFTWVMFAGEELFDAPHGVAVHRGDDDSFELYVADAASGEETDRVVHLRVRFYRESAHASLVQVIERGTGDEALSSVRSMAVDPLLGRLVVADGHSSQRNVKVFDLDGRFQGLLSGRAPFVFEPEAVALYECGGRGAWIASESHPVRTRFHLFRRDGLEYLGWFSGQRTSDSGGITVFPSQMPEFSEGALFAVDDHASLAAFDWKAIEKALGFATCTSQGGVSASRRDR